ncbi:unnamed protein product [Acanthosepion pharaonis]|uniref:DUF7041 domain-containing protein n=1 Tax=Acanthosepion pharaonis TaxID=158019 RepID=A0A812DQM7_ACAPH|nr:unnamed protein product [Sepia pharaonis]
MADPVPLTETAIRLEMPAFNPNVQTWFLQLDAIFQARHVTLQQSKSASVVEKLPAEVAAEVADILTSLPTDKPYETLKQAILHRTGFSEERKIRDLLTNVTIGDSKPSQLLRRMQQLLGDNNISATVFRQMWLDKLPSEMVRILAALTDDVDMQKLTMIADKIADTAPVRQISSTETVDGLVPDVNQQIQKLSSELKRISLQLQELQKPHESRCDNFTQQRNRGSRSTSRHKYQQRRDHYQHANCWYHESFGARAKKCRPPCSYEKSLPNKHAGNGLAGIVSFISTTERAV